MPTTDIVQIIRAIPSLWLCRCGAPLVFFTNANPSFQSQQWIQFCRDHHVEHVEHLHAPAYM